MSWIKSALCRGMQSFAYAVTINLVIGLIIAAVVNKPDFMPMKPEYAAHFSSPLIAFGTQCLLTGVTSMAYGVVIYLLAIWLFEKKRQKDLR